MLTQNGCSDMLYVALSNIHIELCIAIHRKYYIINPQCKFFHFQIAETLHNMGVPLSAKDKQGCTPLHYAALRHNETLVEYFMGKNQYIGCQYHHFLYF